jgi:hypothetical protein
MKKTLTVIGVIIFAPIIFSSCDGSESSNAKKEEIRLVENLKTSIDPLKVDSTDKTQSEKIERANLDCKIYFDVSDFTDEEPQTTKGLVQERKQFSAKKAYTFCYDSESFHHLTISGKGKQLSILVEEDKKVIFKKINFDLDGKLTFSSKEIEIGGGSSKYTIIVKQNETIIFKGEVDSQGCM